MEVRGKGLTALTIVLALVLAAAACARATPTPPPTAEEVLSRARDAMSEVQSYRFSADMGGEGEEGMKSVAVSGEWASPDRLHIRLEKRGEDAGDVNGVIAVGERTFVRDSDYTDGAWQEQEPEPAGEVRPPFDIPSSDDLSDLQMLEDEMINGVSASHVRAMLMTASPVPSRPPSDEASQDDQMVTVVYDFFVSKADYRLLRVKMDIDMFMPPSIKPGEEPDEEQEVHITSRVTYDLYDYNEPTTIEVPEVNGG